MDSSLYHIILCSGLQEVCSSENNCAVSSRATGPSVPHPRTRQCPIHAWRRPSGTPDPAEFCRDFLDPGEYVNTLKANDIDFFTGVPDSLLAQFCAYLKDNLDPTRNLIAANEGNAISIAAGYHMATGRYPCVYLQNSGLGNIINPLLSLAHQGVYGIPMLLMIGWRGEPGKKDEPQHMIQGERTAPLLTASGINFEVLPDYLEGAEEAIESALYHMKNRSCPYAFIVKRQIFGYYAQKSPYKNPYPLSREDCIATVLGQVGKQDPIVATTGFASRELYELQTKAKQATGRSFLCVGSMGHASSIALGVAGQKKTRRVICLDGDGAALMHMGSLAIIGGRKVPNMLHIILNNGCHESVGGQPTVGFDISFAGIAKACGYEHTFKASTKEGITDAMKQCNETNGPNLIEIMCGVKTRGNLGRPKKSPKDNKQNFMDFLSK